MCERERGEGRKTTCEVSRPGCQLSYGARVRVREGKNHMCGMSGRLSAAILSKG